MLCSKRQSKCLKTLKEHINIKRRQKNAYHKIKASLSENNLMLHVNFDESYKSDKQDVIHSVYFGYQCFSIFTWCCYTKSSSNNNVRKDNIIVATERSDHDKVACMSCLQKVVHKIKHLYEKRYENVYVWSDGMGSNLDLAMYLNY